MTSVPYPFKRKWKHKYSPLSFLFSIVEFLFLWEHWQITVCQRYKNNAISNGKNCSCYLLPARNIKCPCVKAHYRHCHYLKNHDPAVKTNAKNTEYYGSQRDLLFSLYLFTIRITAGTIPPRTISAKSIHIP